MIDRDSIWVIDDDQSIRWVLERALKQANLIVRSFDSADDALVAMESNVPEVILCDIRMPGTDGLSFLQRLREERRGLPIIIMTAHSDLETAVAAYGGGAFEYLPKPFDVNEALELVQRACAVARETRPDSATIEEPKPAPEIIGTAPAIQEVFRAIGRLSRSSTTVLINGESGTGKELIARALHRHSPRSGRPFIALNMAAIPRDLLESELFGHEKGSFTGAHGQRKGRFEQANGGTLFLDEIGDMPPELQTRLLRVLADHEFYPIGSYTAVKVDVRIIAATHQNLEDLVRASRFREDLFHRLNVIRLHAPALRERREDIPLLLQHFLETSASELGEAPKKCLPEVEEYLSQLDWPGNVRQLQNVSRWLTVMASGREIHLKDLPAELHNATRANHGTTWEQALRQWADEALRNGKTNLLSSALPSFERILIDTALRRTGGRKQDAARLLGWGRNTLTRKIKELDRSSKLLDKLQDGTV